MDPPPSKGCTGRAYWKDECDPHLLLAYLVVARGAVVVPRWQLSSDPLAEVQPLALSLPPAQAEWDAVKEARREELNGRQVFPLLKSVVCVWTKPSR